VVPPYTLSEFSHVDAAHGAADRLLWQQKIARETNPLGRKMHDGQPFDGKPF
jgi:hypothetical protein